MGHDIRSERIQKVLARAGVGSRRQVDAWISGGRVTVNGRRASPGDRVSAADRVQVDGRDVSFARAAGAPTRVLAYYKPVGEVCSRSDPEQRPSVFSRIPRPPLGRWIGIGRLDLNSSGLLLFTNDGDLAQSLMHPAGRVEREYAIRVHGRATAEQLRRLEAGVRLEDGMARFERVTEGGGTGSNQWYNVVLREGRKREVRRLWESVGLTVSRLIRIRYGPCILPRGRKAGDYWELTGDEIADLRKAAARGS